jgi:hypothetical protein
VRKLKTYVPRTGTGVDQAGAQSLAGKYFIPSEVTQIFPVSLHHDMAPLCSELRYGPTHEAESHNNGHDIHDAHRRWPP